MRTSRWIALAALLVVVASTSRVTAAPRPGLTRLVAQKFAAAGSPESRARAASLMGTQLECITLTRREMRRFGYPGHAFVCREFQTGEVLGAALNARGVPVCSISGSVRADGCFDLTICQTPDAFCFQ